MAGAKMCPNQHTNQLLNTRDAQASLDTLTDASAVKTAHGLMLSAMHSDDDIDWPVHSLLLSLHDLDSLSLRGLPSSLPCSMIFGNIIMMTDMAEP